MTRIPILLASLVFGISLSVHAPSARATEPAGGGPSAAKPASPKARPSASPGAKAQPAAETTLKGKLTCAKCGLHETSTCQNVLIVQDAGAKSETKYYLAKNDVAEAHHEEVCDSQVAATVTGRVHDEGGKKVLTASAITMTP